MNIFIQQVATEIRIRVLIRSIDHKKFGICLLLEYDFSQCKRTERYTLLKQIQILTSKPKNLENVLPLHRRNLLILNSIA